MDLTIHTDNTTQHDLFGLFPGASGGRALRDTYRLYLYLNHRFPRSYANTKVVKRAADFRNHIASIVLK